MKKILSILILLPLLGAGCSSNQQRIIEMQDKQIEELTKKVDALTKNSNNIEGSKTKSEQFNDDTFEKKQSCAKYQKTVEDQFNGKTAVTLFYSPSRNTCVYESVAIKNGQITSKVLGDVFSDDGYVLDQDGKLVYDEKIFGVNKTYNDISNILKN